MPARAPFAAAHGQSLGTVDSGKTASCDFLFGIELFEIN